MLGIVIAAILGIAAGVGIGWVAWQGSLRHLPARVRSWSVHALVPLVSVAAFAGVIAGAVALAEADGSHDELWAQLIAAAFLIGVSVLLYASGARQYTAKRRIVIPHGAAKSVA